MQSVKERLTKIKNDLFDIVIEIEKLSREDTEPAPATLPMESLNIDPSRVYAQGEVSRFLRINDAVLVKLSDAKKIKFSRPNPTGRRKYLGADVLKYLESVS